MGEVARLNDASPCGDMMYLLRKYDVSRFNVLLMLRKFCVDKQRKTLDKSCKKVYNTLTTK